MNAKLLLLVIALSLSLLSGCGTLNPHGVFLPEIDPAEMQASCASPKPPASENADDIEKWLIGLGADYRLCAESERRKADELGIIYGKAGK